MKNTYFLYSATLAIEAVLHAEFGKKKAKVVLPVNTCHRVLSAIIRANCEPVFVYPENGFVITSKDIEKLNENNVNYDAIILVNQFGLYIDVKSVKDVALTCVIIEDISQTIIKEDTGSYSDYVIGSFNKTKPLSIGVGGFILTNKELNNLDYENMASRYSQNLLLPYTLQNMEINMQNLQKKAIQKINKKFKIINLIKKELEKLNIKMYISNFEKNTYNRFPIIFKNEKDAKNFEKTLINCKIKYEKTHLKLLNELLFISDESFEYYEFCDKQQYILYLKLNDAKSGEIKKWLKILKK